MKKLMILGAMFGFASGATLSAMQGASSGVVFWRAVVVSIICAYLFRWWGRIWIRALHQAHNERNSAHGSSGSRN